ncbi:hypothetical protein [Adlercreutzia muris]|jgi:hypothetical protein|uniref:hypothetical protein n=1 Tax=Adlercreutzia muris TaxID=1796610 RepID=UPI0013653A7A|nr:hypothetical protein [Adlercreutzia muris]MCI9494813.1 hypothetical protein [Adlercreutzia mucosicola]NCA31415.1 hypothetical protein [Adlercreutzia muris]
MAEFKEKRLVYYGRNDWSTPSSIERCQSIVKSIEGNFPSGVNEAIELDQCRKIIEEFEEAFDERDRASLRPAIAKAYGFVSTELRERGLTNLYRDVELQYRSPFWDLLESSRATTKLSDIDLDNLLKENPHLLWTLLQKKIIVDEFGSVLINALANNPRIAAELIIEEFGSAKNSMSSIFLPKKLSHKQIDNIMFTYLASSDANLNHVHVLACWPTSAKNYYSPAPKVRVAAQRKERELGESLFTGSNSVQYGVGVSFDNEQLPCLDISGTPAEPIFIYGTKWLLEYHDHATILNNFIYVFQFVNQHGLLCMPANERLVSTLLRALGMQAKDEYAVHDHLFFVHNCRCVATTRGYENLLAQKEASIEGAIDWYFNEYIKQEFGIHGFSVAMPSLGSTFLEKCKAIGPEIERVLKAFTLFVSEGEIDDSVFPFMTFNDFERIPSLLSQKYACPGPLFDAYASPLFSDQPLLSAPIDCEMDHEDAYSLFSTTNTSFNDYYEFQQRDLRQLIDVGLLEVMDDGAIKPTFSADLLRKVWNEGALTPYSLPDFIRQPIDNLVAQNCLKYTDSLLTPAESDYMSYIFNNRRFSNALALRNTYDHASSFIRNPNDSQFVNDYYVLLTAMISLTLKINDELVRWSRNDISMDIIDWPLTGEKWKGLSRALESRPDLTHTLPGQ